MSAIIPFPSGTDGTLSAAARNKPHELGVKDKDIQAILRHSTVGWTMNVYVKSVRESQVSAMDTPSEELGTCTVLAPFLHRLRKAG